MPTTTPALLSRRHRTIAAACAALLVGLLVGDLSSQAAASPSTASTRPGVVTVIRATIDNPVGVTADTRGNVWWTNATNDTIGRRSATGVVTSFHRPGITSPGSIAAGPHQLVWFVNDGLDPNDGCIHCSIGRLSSSGVERNFTKTGMGVPYDIVRGIGGAMWFTDPSSSAIGRVSRHGAITLIPEDKVRSPTVIVAGPDGAMWFVGRGHRVGRITRGGRITSYRTGLTSRVMDLAAGRHSTIWLDDGASIGRLNTQTKRVALLKDHSVTDVGAMASGPDGTLWFVNDDHARIGHLSAAGKISYYTGHGIVRPILMAVAPNGALWFTDQPNKIGHISTTHKISIRTPAIDDPTSIATAPDGSVWFTNLQGHQRLRRVTVNHTIHVIKEPGAAKSGSITAGPAHTMWFRYGPHSIAWRTASGHTHVVTKAAIQGDTSMVEGSDDGMWFADRGAIGRITKAGVVTTYRDTGTINPQTLALGPDGNVWFTNRFGFSTRPGSIGRITPGGVITVFSDASITEPQAIAAGPDGAMWFTNRAISTNDGSIGRITTDGAVSTFTSPHITGAVGAITAGADGAMWFTNDVTDGSDPIARITTSGLVSAVAVPDAALPWSITTGPDGAVWIANRDDSIIRVTTSAD
jgi:virginiamycin B lyase